MLKVNVGLSKKLTHDYNSTGFSVNIEGEVPAPPNDAEGVVNGIRELYDLAEEALDLQIERVQGESALASHDGQPSRRSRSSNGSHNGNGSNGNTDGSRNRFGDGRSHEPEAATQKQISYLLSIGKRNRLSTIELEQRIEGILGETVGVYDLTKREAAQVIDELTAEPASRSRR